MRILIQLSRVGEITDQLPTDVETLHALVAAARAERSAALAERDRALSQIDRLRHLLGWLQGAQFGRRSLRLDPEQMLLAFEDIEQAIAGDEAREEKNDTATILHRRAHQARQSLAGLAYRRAHALGLGRPSAPTTNSRPDPPSVPKHSREISQVLRAVRLREKSPVRA